MNIKIQTAWHHLDTLIHKQNFKTLLELETHTSLVESENLFFDNCWLTIKIFDKGTKKLIIGSDIWGVDGVKKTIDFINNHKKEYRL